MRTFLTAAIIVAIVFLPGQAMGQQIEPNAEVSYDGLHKIKNAAFRYAWSDPEADWARYDKIIPGGAQFQFRAVKKTSSTRAASATSEFWIDDKTKEKLTAEVSAVFADELAKSERFTVVDKPGPDVLIIRGGLGDIVSRVPPDQAGRHEVYLSSVGEATLLLEVVDSMSGEVLFRGLERRSAERTGPMRSSTATTYSEVRRLARRWGEKLRKGLDALPTE